MFQTLNYTEEKSHLPLLSLQKANSDRFADLFGLQFAVSNRGSGCIRNVKPIRKSLLIKKYVLDVVSGAAPSFREESAKQLEDLTRKAMKKRKLNNKNHSEYLQHLRQKTVPDISVIIFSERMRKHQRRT